jgi:hypothetical protein
LKFVLNLHFKATKVAYVLNPPKVTDRPATWTEENIAVCSVIAKTIDLAILCYIQDHKEDAAAMWRSLAKAHQSSASGNRI